MTARNRNRRGARFGASDAMVVFSGNADLKWAKFLKPEFRHCFVACRRGSHWVFVNPLAHQTEILLHEGIASDDLGRWYRDRGYRVVACRIRVAPRRLAPLRPFTCVEAVKRVLGLHLPHVFTPWQLFKHLKSHF